MSAFVQPKRFKHALLMATTLSSKGRLIRPFTSGMESCVVEFLPGLTKHSQKTVSVESMADAYTDHNRDVSDTASDFLDTQVDDLVTYVRDVITTARERVVPVAKQIETLLCDVLIQFDDVFEVSSNTTNSNISAVEDLLDIPATIREPSEIPAIAIPKSDNAIVQLLRDSQVFPSDVTNAFVDSVDDQDLVSYYNVFYDGRFSSVLRELAPSNASVAKDCLIVGLMASEYFARNVDRASGSIDLDLWNRTVATMTRFCLARFAACQRAEEHLGKMQKVITSVVKEGNNYKVELNHQFTKLLSEQDVPVEVILGSVLVHGNEATQLTVDDFVSRRDIFSRRYQREVPMLRLSVRNKQLAAAKQKLVSFVASNVNPSSNTMTRLRNDPYLSKLTHENISAIAAYVAANYVVGNSMAAVYLEMMEMARGSQSTGDARATAAAATVDFVALVLASNIDVGHVAPVEVVTRTEV